MHTPPRVHALDITAHQRIQHIANIRAAFQQLYNKLDTLPYDLTDTEVDAIQHLAHSLLGDLITDELDEIFTANHGPNWYDALWYGQELADSNPHTEPG